MTDKKKESPKYIAKRDIVLQQLKSGKFQTGESGIFAPIVKEFLESALSVEMESHFDANEHSFGNKRNGKGSKILKTLSGEITIETPQYVYDS